MSEPNVPFAAVGFDYGGVIKGVPGSVFRQRICALLNVTDEQFGTAYFAHNQKFNRGEVATRELWRLILADLDCSDALPAMMQLLEAQADEPINPDVLEIVDWLRGKRIKTGLLSNTSAEAGQEMRRLGIDKHFDVFHISAETGYTKPDEIAFRHLAADLGVEMHEMIFIDDAPKSLSTANSCGFVPVLFESSEKLKEQLRNLGIF